MRNKPVSIHCAAKRILSALIALAIIVVMLLCSIISAAALEDRYSFDDLGMSVGIPRDLYVITRDSSPDDPVFETLKLDYDEVIAGFKSADVYLRAYDSQGLYQISLTVSSDDNSRSINSYDELSEASRKTIQQNLLSDTSVSSAVEVKHGDRIFFDTSRQTTLDKKTVYINQCNTIANGMQVDISLQKPNEAILPDEATVLTDIASSLDFVQQRGQGSGLKFEWWRLLLWVFILAALAVSTSFIYRNFNSAQKRKLEERRQRSAASRQPADIPDDADIPQVSLSFDEALGYQTEEEFSSRASTDMDSYDIKVTERDPHSGVSYFEDEGDSIDDGSDYFDTYFKEPTERRSGIGRLMSVIGANIKFAFTHLGYFFKNLFRAITHRKGRR